MKQSRRDFLKTIGIGGAAVTGLSSKKAHAAPKNIQPDRLPITEHFDANRAYFTL